MIELLIEKTYRMMGKGHEWTRSTDDRKTFDNMAQAKDFLKSEYGNCTRKSSYVDKKDGSTEKTGMIMCFKNSEYQDGKMVHFSEQHWITFWTVSRVRLEGMKICK